MRITGSPAEEKGARREPARGTRALRKETPRTMTTWTRRHCDDRPRRRRGGPRGSRPERRGRPRPAQARGPLREGQLLHRVPRRRREGPAGGPRPPGRGRLHVVPPAPRPGRARCGSRRTSRRCASTATTRRRLGLEAGAPAPGGRELLHLPRPPRLRPPGHPARAPSVSCAPAATREAASRAASSTPRGRRLPDLPPAPRGRGTGPPEPAEGGAVRHLSRRLRRVRAPPTGASRWRGPTARPAIRPTPRPARSLLKASVHPVLECGSCHEETRPMAAPADGAAVCLSCHEAPGGRGREPAPAGRRGGVPDVPRSAHHRQRPAAGERRRRTLCTQCHDDVAEALAGEYPHTMAAECTSCHQGHRSDHPSPARRRQPLAVRRPATRTLPRAGPRSSTCLPPASAPTATSPTAPGRQAMLTETQGDLCGSCHAEIGAALRTARAPRPGGGGGVRVVPRAPRRGREAPQGLGAGAVRHAVTTGC